MKKIGKRIGVSFLALGLVFSLTACGSKPASTTASTSQKTETKTIGFVPMTLNNQYFITMVNGAKLEAKKKGVKLDVSAGDSHDSAEQQLKIVETMIQNKVSAICVVPSSSESLIPALKEAEKAGIPVINIDTIFDQSLLKSNNLKDIPFLGTNNKDGAKSAGEFALTLFPNKKAKVAILTGIAGQQNTADRRDGFYEVVKDKFDIVAEQSANWDIEQGYNVAQNIISAHPDLDLIFAGNDEMALGAERAIKASGKDIKVIGFDGSAEALDSVEKGELSATVAQFPGEMGIKGVDTALDIINGKKASTKVDTGSKLITKENVADFKKYLKKFE